MRIALVGAAMVTLAYTPAWAWIAEPYPSNNGSALAVGSDAAGNVFAAGNRGGVFSVAKLNGSDGTTLWTATLPNAGEAWALAVDASGNPIVSGRQDPNGNGMQFYLSVAKFAGSNGAQQWLRELPASLGYGYDIALDASGNAVVAGGRDGASSVSKTNGSTGALMWEFFDGGTFNGVMRAVGVDGSGNVIAGGDDGVVKLLPGGGGPMSTAWVWNQYTTGDVRVNSLAVDASGDPILAGWSPLSGLDRSFTVVRLSGANGAVVWRRDISGDTIAQSTAVSVKIDANGDVLVAGHLVEGGVSQFAVLKLDGSTGADVWAYELPYGTVEDITLDSAGNVIATGNMSGAAPTPGMHVVKLQNSNGAVLWQQTLGQSSDWTYAVAVDGNGDVAAAGSAQLGATAGVEQMVAFKLVGTSGAEFGPTCGDGAAQGAEECDDGGLVDGDGCSSLCRDEPVCGNSVVEISEGCDDGNLVNGDGCSSVCAIEEIGPEGESEAATPGVPVTTDTEMDGATMTDPVETTITTTNGGTVTIYEIPTEHASARYALLGWNIELSIPAATPADPNVIVFRIDPSLVPAGENENTIVILKDGVPVADCTGPVGEASPDPCVSDRQVLMDGDIQFTILSSTASLWQLVVHPESQLLAGTKLSIRDNSDATKRKLTFGASGASVAMGAPGSENDPTCTGTGDASIEIFNPATGESSNFDLPCQNWVVLGKPGAEKGYKYKDKEHLAGPVTQAMILADKKISAKASGNQFSFTLNENSQDELGVALTTGPGANYCTVFGGDITKDEPMKFSAKGALAPAACP